MLKCDYCGSEIKDKEEVIAVGEKMPVSIVLIKEKFSNQTKVI